ncbi:hypothetical protein [Amycolatopsis methanolica]|uniref:hypothetical protein n=1 Tax=Amycolatopsis methanolica TaxID=1814 RepID=UPI001428938E|nr:hypothetical protein [Amycolatopsis methanolica]
MARQSAWRAVTAPWAPLSLVTSATRSPRRLQVGRDPGEVGGDQGHAVAERRERGTGLGVPLFEQEQVTGAGEVGGDDRAFGLQAADQAGDRRGQVRVELLDLTLVPRGLHGRGRGQAPQDHERDHRHRERDHRHHEQGDDLRADGPRRQAVDEPGCRRNAGMLFSALGHGSLIAEFVRGSLRLSSVPFANLGKARRTPRSERGRNPARR